MGAVRVEIYRKTGKFESYMGKKSQMPVQVSTETSTTTATAGGARIAVAAAGGFRQLFARLSADEIVFAAIGSNPVATNATGWQINANESVEDIPVIPGDLFSFKDLA